MGEFMELSKKENEIRRKFWKDVKYIILDELPVKVRYSVILHEYTTAKEAFVAKANKTDLIIKIVIRSNTTDRNKVIECLIEDSVIGQKIKDLPVYTELVDILVYMRDYQEQQTTINALKYGI